MMRKGLSLFLLCLWASELFAAEPQVGIGQVDPNRGPCVSVNYTRTAPGLCLRKSVVQVQSTGVNTCVGTVIAELPVTVKSVLLQVRTEIVGIGVVGNIVHVLNFYPEADSTCSSLANRSLYLNTSSYDHTGTVNTLRQDTTLVQYYISGNKTVYSQRVTTGGSSSYVLELYGYHD